MEVQCVLDAKANTGESPVWCPEARVLYWVDIPGCKLHRFDPASGESRTWDMPAPVGCLAVRRSGGLLVALKTGLHTFDPATALSSPPTYGYFLFIILSVLRLDFKLCAFTGFVAASSSVLSLSW